MNKIYKFNEDFEGEYWGEEERIKASWEAFKNRRRIGFKIGGHKDPLEIDDKSRYRYNLLNDKIKIQEENVRKMKDGGEKDAETNQLNQMKKVRDKIKEENKFESLNYLRRFSRF